MIPMRLPRAAFVAVVLSSASVVGAAASLWSRGGPEGASVTVLADDPQSPQTVYAASYDGGIWKTTDGAAHWKPAYGGLPTLYGHFAPINAIAVDPAVSSRVYAAMNIGLYESDDSGTSWSESGASVLKGKFLNAIAIDPNSSSTVFVGTSSGVYVSTDAGVNWKPSNAGLVDGSGHTPGVESLVVNPAVSSSIIAGTNGAGTFLSTNGGQSWTKFGGTALDDVDVTGLMADPGNIDSVYALSPEIGLLHLVPSGSAGAAAVVRGDAGQNWANLVDDNWVKFIEQTEECGGSPCFQVFILLLFRGPKPLLAASPAPFASGSVTEMLVGTSGRGIFHSLDDGSTFTAINDGLPSSAISSIVGDPSSLTRYAGSGVAGVAKTTDDARWSAANTGLFAAEVYSLAASKSSPSIVYAATDASIFKSSDAGVSWQNLTSVGVDQQVWPVLAVDPTNPSVVYAATDEKGVIKTSNGGGSWTAMQTGLTTTAIGALAIDPTAHATIYAATVDGMYGSVDGAAHWTLLSADVSDMHALAIDPVAHQTVYTGGFGGVFRSTDGGANWSRISGSNPFVDSSGVAGIAVDPSSHTTVYVANQQGIWKTSDGGASWRNLTAGLPDTLEPSVSAVAITPGTPSTIYIAFVGVVRGAGNGVYKSTNGGASWTAVEPGLDDAGVDALAVSSGSSPILYAGTLGGGVFRSPPAAAPPPPGKRRIIPVQTAQPVPAERPH